jgi:hypothetical protein
MVAQLRRTSSPGNCGEHVLIDSQCAHELGNSSHGASIHRVGPTPDDEDPAPMQRAITRATGPVAVVQADRSQQVLRAIVPADGYARVAVVVAPSPLGVRCNVASVDDAAAEAYLCNARRIEALVRDLLALFAAETARVGGKLSS